MRSAHASIYCAGQSVKKDTVHTVKPYALLAMHFYTYTFMQYKNACFGTQNFGEIASVNLHPKLASVQGVSCGHQLSMPAGIQVSDFRFLDAHTCSLIVTMETNGTLPVLLYCSDVGML